MITREIATGKSLIVGAIRPTLPFVHRWVCKVNPRVLAGREIFRAPSTLGYSGTPRNYGESKIPSPNMNGNPPVHNRGKYVFYRTNIIIRSPIFQVMPKKIGRYAYTFNLFHDSDPHGKGGA